MLLDAIIQLGVMHCLPHDIVSPFGHLSKLGPLGMFCFDTQKKYNTYNYSTNIVYFLLNMVVYYSAKASI